MHLQWNKTQKSVVVQYKIKIRITQYKMKINTKSQLTSARNREKWGKNNPEKKLF